jgi:hypothetical protein
VPNTKVVANIQIYLHAEFHIFLRFLSIFSIFISLMLIFQFGKGINIGKRINLKSNFHLNMVDL